MAIRVIGARIQDFFQLAGQTYMEMAERASTPASKVENYCKASLSQVAQGNLQAANMTLNQATVCIDFDDSYGRVEMVCEIVKVRLTIAPGIVPDELKRAAKSEEGELETDKIAECLQVLVPYHVEPFCLLAKQYHSAGDTEGANALLTKAIECWQSEKRTDQSLRSLLRISETECHLGLLKDSVLVLEAVLAAIPSLKLVTSRIEMWTKAASLALLHNNCNQAGEIIKCAADEFKLRFGKPFEAEPRGIEAPECQECRARISEVLEDLIAALESLAL